MTKREGGQLGYRVWVYAGLDDEKRGADSGNGDDTGGREDVMKTDGG